MMKSIILSLALFLSLPIFAQKLKTVEGEYTYHVPDNVTMEEARRTALDRAKIQALADAFGTIVSQFNATRVENRNGKSDIDFSSIGGSEVKGEWIETIGEPIYDIRYVDGMMVVTVKVKGKAREIVSAAIDYQAHILRNGTEERFEDDQFRSGDDLFLSFTSPVKGYLAVYLVDADGQAFCLLPYRNQAEGIYPIEANRRYLFFHAKSVPPAERILVDEYVLTCERSMEHNFIYVIFSPNPFAKASDTNADDALPRQLSHGDFQKWLVKCRKRDKDMDLRLIPITITK
ncbi:MAG: DUF4384 domain-containing protein [Prevotella sp.]|nr:DUF4384 domain-containing protein [Prevotella sp.]